MSAGPTRQFMAVCEGPPDRSQRQPVRYMSIFVHASIIVEIDKLMADLSAKTKPTASRRRTQMTSDRQTLCLPEFGLAEKIVSECPALPISAVGTAERSAAVSSSAHNG